MAGLQGWETGRWYYFNDSSVRQCSAEDVASDKVPGSRGLQAVLLVMPRLNLLMAD